MDLYFTEHNLHLTTGTVGVSASQSIAWKMEKQVYMLQQVRVSASQSIAWKVESSWEDGAHW